MISEKYWFFLGLTNYCLWKINTPTNQDNINNQTNNMWNFYSLDPQKLYLKCTQDQKYKQYLWTKDLTKSQSFITIMV